MWRMWAGPLPLLASPLPAWSPLPRPAMSDPAALGGCSVGGGRLPALKENFLGWTCLAQSLLNASHCSLGTGRGEDAPGQFRDVTNVNTGRGDLARSERGVSVSFLSLSLSTFCFNM